MKKLRKILETLTQFLFVGTLATVGLTVLTAFKMWRILAPVGRALLFVVKLIELFIVSLFKLVLGAMMIGAFIGSAYLFKLAFIDNVGELYDIYKTEGLVAFNPKDIEKNTPDQIDSIIRLYDTEGNFICSATVIDDNYALTAAHCVMENAFPKKSYLKTELKDEYFRISTKDDEPTDVVAFAAAARITADVGLVKGDFSGFQKMPVDIGTAGILTRHQLITCGFPGNDQLTCYPLFNAGPDGFLITGKGVLYKGMSGGPVIDVVRGDVVAVNSRAMMNGYISVGPLIGVFKSFGIIR